MGNDERLHGPGKSHHQNLGQLGVFTMTKRGGGTSIRSGGPARALVQVSRGGSGDGEGLDQDGLHPNAFLLDAHGKERVVSKNLVQEGRKRSCSLPSGMWNFADDLLDFFPKPELPK